jgi:hypothetical protein
MNGSGRSGLGRHAAPSAPVHTASMNMNVASAGTAQAISSRQMSVIAMLNGVEIRFWRSQPTGPVNFAALVLALFGESTTTLRLSMALFGVATVFCTYRAARAMFGRAVALLAAALLAAQPWHLHLSRTAFMVNAWPCLEMVALWALFRARRHGGWARWALAGVIAGLGVYTYNAYPLSVPLLVVPVLYDFWRPGAGRSRTRVVADAALAGAIAFVVALPMLEYTRTHEEYFWHHQDVALTHSAAWRDADWSARAGLLEARAVEWGKGLLVGGRPDDGDGLGAKGFPLLDPVAALAALVGMGMAVRTGAPAAATLLVALAVLPFGALLTIEDGLFAARSASRRCWRSWRRCAGATVAEAEARGPRRVAPRRSRSPDCWC